MVEEKEVMTIQQAAANILRRFNYPIKAKDIAKIALQEDLVAKSKAKNPIISLSQVLERNIRMGMGNKPRLVFINTDRGRLIGLPEMEINYNEKKDIDNSTENEEVCLISLLEKYFDRDTIQKIEIYMKIKGYFRIEDAIVSLIKRGLVASTSEVLNILKNEFEKLEND